MPKSKPAPVEYFMVRAPCPKEKLGEAVAALSRLDLHEVHFDLVTAVPAFAKRTNHEVSSEDALLEWIKEHPTFRAMEAVKHFEANGRTKGATYPALGVLVEKKVLKKLGPGNYARVDVKHLAAPEKKKAKDKPRSGNRYEVKHTDFILKYARRNHGRFSAAKVKDAFDRDGRGRDSVSSAIDTLVKRKHIKRVGGGEYVLLAKATKNEPAAKFPSERKTNDTPTETVEATNG